VANIAIFTAVTNHRQYVADANQHDLEQAPDAVGKQLTELAVISFKRLPEEIANMQPPALDDFNQFASEKIIACWERMFDMQTHSTSNKPCNTSLQPNEPLYSRLRKLPNKHLRYQFLQVLHYRQQLAQSRTISSVPPLNISLKRAPSTRSPRRSRSWTVRTNTQTQAHP